MLLVCSQSTRNFLPEYKRVRIVTGAPTKDILTEIGSEQEVVAIGGGAVIDTAKILSANPICCYPTTASGSSSTSWSVYWEGSKKCSLKRLVPKKVLFDEQFVIGLSEDMIMATTCDVVSHCLDSLCSKKATEQSRDYCHQVLVLLRQQAGVMALIKAGHIAGKAIEITGTNLLHSLSYPLTGHYNIPHGIALGYFLPKLAKYMGHNIEDIIGGYNINLDFDLDLVLDEAFNYSKIYETMLDVTKNVLRLLINRE